MLNLKNSVGLDAVEDKEKAFTVESVMSSVAKFVDKETADKYRTEGMECNFAEIVLGLIRLRLLLLIKLLRFPPLIKVSLV